LTTATPTNTPAATLATAEALCEVNDSISSVAGVNLSTLQEALVCENQFSGIVDCTQTPAPAKFVVCARANAQSVTGLLSPILDGIWVSSVSAGTITGTASTMWNAPSYNSSAGSSNPVVCPPNPTYTVSFDPNGATGGTMLPQTADSSTALTANSFTYQGYTFAGWNTAANGSGTPYGDGATYPFTVSATLYAQWTLNPTYTVTFDPNGGSGTMSPENANSPTALNLNAFNPSPPDTTFTGWNTAQDGSGTAYPDGAIYPFTSSVTLYAQWS
jgi:hypothetical protein